MASIAFLPDIDRFPFNAMNKIPGRGFQQSYAASLILDLAQLEAVQHSIEDRP